jgi:hypothetical protein
VEQVIVERILSVSFIAALPAEEKERVTAQLRQVAATTPELAGKAQVSFPYETLAIVCNKTLDSLLDFTAKMQPDT